MQMQSAWTFRPTHQNDDVLEFPRDIPEEIGRDVIGVLGWRARAIHVAHNPDGSVTVKFTNSEFDDHGPNESNEAIKVRYEEWRDDLAADVAHLTTPPHAKRPRHG